VGGGFMFKLAIYSLTALICGSLYIQAFPIENSYFTNLLTEYILSPLEFFLGSVVFVIGFLCQSLLMTNAIRQTLLLLRGREYHLGELLISYSFLLNLIILATYGFWQTCLFFIFSSFYGMIALPRRSVDRY